MAKPIETDRWAVVSEPGPKQFLDDRSWSQSRHFYMVEPEPETWVPVTEPRFVGQAS